jgi:hypothetical protein
LNGRIFIKINFKKIKKFNPNIKIKNTNGTSLVPYKIGIKLVKRGFSNFLEFLKSNVSRPHIKDLWHGFHPLFY